MIPPPPRSTPTDTPVPYPTLFRSFSRYFKQQNQKVQIGGVQPDGESSIPGIRKWPEAYLPSIYDASRIDRVIEASTQNAEDTMRLAGSKEEIGRAHV